MSDSEKVGRAVVIGASMAGLLAAKAAASHFAEVVVIERDQLPDGAAHRRCVPQGRHVHGLLSGGRQAIEALLPGFVARAQAGGAMPGDFSQDCMIWAGGGYHRRFHGGLPAMLISRCLIEATVRDTNNQIVSERGYKLAADPKVTLPTEQDAVEKLIAGESDLDYTMAVEIVPPIELTDFKTIKLTKLTSEVADAEVDEALVELLRRSETRTGSIVRRWRRRA